jgi:hypothetical protein
MRKKPTNPSQCMWLRSNHLHPRRPLCVRHCFIELIAVVAIVFGILFKLSLDGGIPFLERPSILMQCRQSNTTFCPGIQGYGRFDCGGALVHSAFGSTLGPSGFGHLVSQFRWLLGFYPVGFNIHSYKERRYVSGGAFSSFSWRLPHSFLLLWNSIATMAAAAAAPTVATSGAAVPSIKVTMLMPVSSPAPIFGRVLMHGVVCFVPRPKSTFPLPL